MAEPLTVASILAGITSLFGGGGGSDGPSKEEFLAGMTVLNQQIEDTFQHLRGNTDRNLQAIIQTGSNVHQAVAANIQDQNNLLVPILQGGFNAILGKLGSGQQGVSSQDIQAINSVLDAILGNTNVIRGSQSAIVSSVLQPTLNGVRDLNNDVDSLLFGIDEGFSGVFGALDKILGEVSNQSDIVVQNEILIEAGLFDGVLTNVNGIVDAALARQQGTIDGLSGTFTNLVNGLISIITDSGIVEQDHLKRIADVMDILQGPTLENLAKMGQGGLDGFGGKFSEGTLGSLGQFFNQLAPNARRQMNQVLYGHDHPADNDNCGLLAWDDTWIDSSVPNWIAETMIWIVTALMIPLNASQVKANKVMQDYRRCFPDMLLQSGDIIGAWYKGLIDDNKALTDLEKQGFTHDDAETLLTASETYPTIDLVFSMWFRQLITDETKDNYLRGLGYGQFSREKLSEIAFFIPPVQDLITMAVREVFTPEVARANGQFDDLPPDFVNWARQQGVSEQWAENYWAAHWQLPSPQMGFEMFHRQEIDEERLRGLMVALDIMPGWRDEMIAISYNPLSRVDVRRMHALGVLDDAAVEKSYRDIGYSPENAKLMLDFTKRYNEDEDLATLDIASDLTRSNIVGFYKDGIIDRTVALGLLLQAGINAIAAELFMQSADFDIERADRSGQIGLILDKYKHRVFTFAEANDALNALNLAEKERANASIELTKVRQSLNKVPSRTDLDKFLAAAIITPDDYIDSMILNGYSRDWAEKYLLLASGVEDGSAN